MKKESYGTHDIARICHVTPPTVGRWIDAGVLPCFTTVGGHRKVLVDDLLAFLKQYNIPVPEELRASGAAQVLVVDDEEPIRRVVKRALAKLSPAVESHEAADGFEAGQKLLQLKPALVVLDIKLPGIDGIKVCRSIRADPRLKKTRILAISGKNPDQSREDALQAGADDFLAKPFQPQDLLLRIEKLVPQAAKS